MTSLSKEQFMKQVREDIGKKNKSKDAEFYAYMKESRLKRRKNWNVKLGGFKY
ncbi:hypothetical protein [Clostridium algidicarnis]|uniref:hypothetical protein n=1 Tax=Clostridium algidicarnis TaxID=37659 RepID=UPI001C0C1B2D|nr:hypothetical protein [Clostridium algidicarnis]MBU3195676.1 hypothetical protein [Clostridium algidicarnis]MBU3205165.1 hypothetical protein [Clostridium algidicarnis]MBU3208557.1 hypothetical protein [Clostridium algidicarnis]MBU3213318.1 hypothetical protein [Clostridium algidicarnis]MBU3223787.1 hypothetical protein [Clostridium algidicarnis]